LFYDLAANIAKEDEDIVKHRPYIGRRIKDGSLRTKDQVLGKSAFILTSFRGHQIF
jgi:hypothetical protein